MPAASASKASSRSAIDLPYRSGRGEHWLKSKCVAAPGIRHPRLCPLDRRQGRGRRAAARLLRRAASSTTPGRVGTGYSAEQSTERCATQLDKIAAAKPKLANALPGRRREGRALGGAAARLRGRVSRLDAPTASAPGLLQGAARGPAAPKRSSSKWRPRRREPERSARHRRAVRLTHPERILWPEPGITKQGLAEFYTDIADWILPHIAGRVLSLVRCPSGVGEKCFFAKHAWDGLSDALQPRRCRREGADARRSTISTDCSSWCRRACSRSIPGARASAQLEQPDRLIFDLDPGEDVPWSAVIEAALEVRTQLDDDSASRASSRPRAARACTSWCRSSRASTGTTAKAFTQSVAERDGARRSPSATSR